MIQEYLTKHSAASASDSLECLNAAEGETVIATISVYVEDLKTQYMIIFKSGTSLVFSSSGAYWINSEKETMEIIMRELQATEHYVIKHDKLHQLVKSINP